MPYLLRQIFELIRLLNSDTGANAIAAGVACGLILGFAPAFSLQTVLVIVVLFLFRIQVGAALISAFFFAFVAWLLDPLHHAVGVALLEAEALTPLFTTLYHMPLVPLTRFYNSITLGAGVVSIALAPFVFLLARRLVNAYRATVAARLRETRVWKLWHATPFYKWYQKYAELYG
ncbi:MAG: TIGR03546 family protein [Thiohalomonadaceae bacterium]